MAKAYEELTFADNFMFCKIMSTKPEICRKLLELVLDVKIRKVGLPINQKGIEITYDGKGVRFDAYVEDENNTVYDIEMQKVDTKELPKRSRYYQGMIDLDLIEKGADYDKLNKSFVIFICLTDPFEKGYPVYTFENICVQDKDVYLNDETVKVFVNASSTMPGIPEGLKNLFDYLETNKANDDLTREISESVSEAIEHKMWRIDYMTNNAFYMDARSEGEERGKEKATEAIVVSMLRKNLSAKEISELCDIPLEIVEKIQNKILQGTPV